MDAGAAHGALRFHNTRPAAWDTVCTPAAASDLCKDPASGALFVPPVEYASSFTRQDTGQIQIPVAFGSTYQYFLHIPNASLPKKVCNSRQYMLISTFTVNAQMNPNTCFEIIDSVGASTPPVLLPWPPTSQLEHSRMKCFADSGAAAGTTYPMARTDTLARSFFNNPSFGGDIYAWMGLYAFQHSSGNTPPVITRLIIETTIVGFDEVAGSSTPAY